MRGVIFVVASTIAVTASSAAYADAGTSSTTYSYEVDNADAHADKVLVAWPRTCGASGDPLGSVDLARNPDWAARMNEVDYEVVVKGRRHALDEHCTKTTRLYALPAEAFARGTRPSTADDRPIGQQDAGVPFAIVPALDAITLDKRIAFFEKDPRVLRTSFRFDPAKAQTPTRPPLKAVHEVLAVDGFDATSFAVVVKSAVYTYMDGRTELLGAEALAPVAPAAAAPSAGGDVESRRPGGGPGKQPGDAPKHDLGTRWVYLAAIGGLIVGGILAMKRKNAATK